MKYLERTFYRGYWHFGNGSSATITNWFKIKDWVFRGIKHVTKRHRRSVAQRDLHRLLPQYNIRSYYGYPLRISIVFLKTTDGLTTVDLPRFKSNIRKPCHRLIWRRKVQNGQENKIN